MLRHYFACVLATCHIVLAVSGVVCEVSNQARENSDLREGDKVMALVGGGGYAGMLGLEMCWNLS